MGLNLVKGQSPVGGLNLAKEAPGVTKFIAGLGWDANPNATGPVYDLDLAAFALDAQGHLLNNDASNVCYFNNKEAAAASLKLSGDNRTGAGDGDDENLTIDLTRVPAEVAEISLVATIYEADKLGLNFGVVKNAFMKIVEEGGREVLKIRLDEAFASATGVQLSLIHI